MKNKAISYYDSMYGESSSSKHILNLLVNFFDEYNQNSNIAMENNMKNRKINSICIDLTYDKVEDETANTNKDKSISSNYNNENEILIENEYNQNIHNSISKSWIIYYARCPKQNNFYDCGVFACKFLDYLSINKIPTFTQEDMEYFRTQIACELINGKLMTN